MGLPDCRRVAVPNWDTARLLDLVIGQRAMTTLQKIYAGLTIWILVLIVIMLTIGTYRFAMRTNGIRIDCTTHGFSPDATKEQRELCRSAK